MLSPNNDIFISKFESSEIFTDILNKIKLNILNTFDKIRLSNQNTLIQAENSITFYIAWLNSMREQIKNRLKETLKINNFTKIMSIRKIDNLYKNFSITHRPLSDKNYVSLEDIENFQKLAEDIENDISFVQLGYKSLVNWTGILYPCVKVTSDNVLIGNKGDDKLEVHWFSYDSEAKVWIGFNKVIENQLEKGFKSMNAMYYIHKQNHGPIFAVANFKEMTLTYVETKQKMELVRK